MLGAIEETTAEDVERVYRTNVFGLLNVVRAVLPAMRQRRAGHIINFSSLGGYRASLGGYRASAGWGVYCSSTFAVEGINEALHDELAPLGIHATVVEPGFFRTDFMDNRSLLETRTQIADYEETVGKTRIFAVERNHQQPGDPAKLAQTLLQLVNAADPPLRLALGTDALERIAQKNAFRLAYVVFRLSLDGLDGGERGIRTLGTGYPVRQISNVTPVREYSHLSKSLRDTTHYRRIHLIARHIYHLVLSNLIQSGKFCPS